MAHHADIRNFKCNVNPCNKSFNTKVDLNQHLKSHGAMKEEETDANLSCNLCDLSFPTSHNYNHHMSTHAPKEEQTCPYCLKPFRILADHIKNVHMEKQFLCGFEGCDKSFAKKHGLTRHLKTHSDDFKQFQCPDCQRMFVEKIQLERHYQVHRKAVKITNHRCEKCLKYFNRRADLVRHSLSVHQEKLFQCDLCPDRRFGNKFEVLRHFKAFHFGEKYRRRKAAKVPIEDIIDGEFVIREFENDATDKLEVKIEAIEEQNYEIVMVEVLERVEAVDERPAEVKIFAQQPPDRWECQRCCRNFESLQRLKLHNSRNHNWKCKLCPGGSQAVNLFHRREDFELHWMENHGHARFPDKLQCSICLDMFADKAAIHTHQKNEHDLPPPVRVRHEAAKRLICRHCEEEFKTPSSLKKHSFQVHQDGSVEWRKCFFCNLQFKLFDSFKAHVATHRNDFACLVCGGKPFASFKTLRKHQLEEHYRCSAVKPWQCDLCFRRFHCRALIERHMTEVHLRTAEQNICDICGRIYLQLQSLRVHRINAHGEKKFQCPCEGCDKGWEIDFLNLNFY